jgi:putative membrane protein
MLVPVAYLPALNAALNATSATLLIIGYLFIRRRKVTEHRTCMLSAFVTSSLFLVSYLTLRYYSGMTRFTGQGGSARSTSRS